MKGRTVVRWIRRLWITAGLSLTAWMIWSVQAHGVPADALVSDETVRVERGADVWRLTPIPPAPADRAGLIFLPGGGIDPRAYVPLARAVAEEGHPVSLVELPFRTAMTERSRVELWRRIVREVETASPRRPWVLSGHSRGAALAARFLSTGPGPINGLALIATTHPRDQDLSDLSIPVMKIMGTADCVASLRQARANAGKLPADTEWVEIAGANHAQFGYYGSQLHDCGASITRDAQQRRAREALLAVLERAGGPASARTGH